MIDDLYQKTCIFKYVVLSTVISVVSKVHGILYKNLIRNPCMYKINAAMLLTIYLLYATLSFLQMYLAPQLNSAVPGTAV